MFAPRRLILASIATCCVLSTFAFIRLSQSRAAQSEAAGSNADEDRRYVYLPTVPLGEGQVLNASITNLSASEDAEITMIVFGRERETDENSGVVEEFKVPPGQTRTAHLDFKKIIQPFLGDVGYIRFQKHGDAKVLASVWTGPTGPGADFETLLVNAGMPF